jgi:hypothetical protein
MLQIREMISRHPDVKGNTNDALIRCIEECHACAQICLACADACIAEDNVKELTQCIRLDLDCADVCSATGVIASRRSGSNEPLIRQMLEVCADACRSCAAECSRHARMHEHCRLCADACQSCEEACRAALPAVKH